jgi:hypothetical protein
LHDIVAEVFTALAYTKSADVLGPLIEWDLSKDISVKQRQHRVKLVQSRFQKENPPPILILDGPATHASSSLPEIVLWNDKESSPFTNHRQLPSPPAWPGPGVAPAAWLNFPFKNYGIHTRDEDSTRPRYIALSHELVDFFQAACTAYDVKDTTAEEHMAARESLDAAIGCLKGTLVHELAHLWVTETVSFHIDVTNKPDVELNPDWTIPAASAS